MHQNSLSIMQGFVKKYLPNKKLKILDLGSMIVPNRQQRRIGSYRQFFTNPKWHYVGADIKAGENVDAILTDGYTFPFSEGEFDVVISGQTIQHIAYPWVWFKEMARVLKKNGLCCIIAPALFSEHRSPIDTYRYYPDGMRALAKWSGLEVLEAETTKAGYMLEDTYMIAKKP